MMKKIVLILCFVLFLSAGAMALKDCPDKGYFEFANNSFEKNITIVPVSINNPISNYCGLEEGKSITVYAKYPLLSSTSSPTVIEVPVLKITMLRYNEDALGGIGENDSWLFGLDFLNPVGNSVKHVEKDIKEFGTKAGPLDYEMSIDLPDGSGGFTLKFLIDADEKYAGETLNGGQIELLKVTALQDVGSIVQKLAGSSAAIPKSKELVARENQLEELKKLAATIPNSDSRKAELNVEITKAEAALKDDATAEEKAGMDKLIDDALKTAKEITDDPVPAVAGETGILVVNLTDFVKAGTITNVSKVEVMLKKSGGTAYVKAPKRTNFGSNKIILYDLGVGSKYSVKLVFPNSKEIVSELEVKQKMLKNDIPGGF